MSDRISFPRFQRYVANSVVVHHQDLPSILMFQGLIKGYFDLLKNVIVVAAMGALAKKTQNYFLNEIYGFSLAMFGGYLAVSLNRWHFDPFHFVRARWLRLSLGMMFWLPLVMGVLVGGVFALNEIVNLIIAGNLLGCDTHSLSAPSLKAPSITRGMLVLWHQE